MRQSNIQMVRYGVRVLLCETFILYRLDFYFVRNNIDCNAVVIDTHRYFRANIKTVRF